MPYPENFYYYVKTSAVHYSHVYSGMFDINQLLRGLPYWKQPYSSRVKKPKTIILGDWTAIKWPIEKKEAVIRKLEQLLNDGFSVLLWQDGIVVSFSRQSLNCLMENKILAAISPTFPEEIKQAAVRQKKVPSFDAIHVLDFHDLNSLLLGKDPSTIPRLLEIEALNSEKLESIKLLLKKESPPKTILVHNFFDSRSNNYIHPLAADLQGFQWLRKYTGLGLKGNNLEELITNKKITLKGETFTKEELKSIQEIVLEDTSYECLEVLQNIDQLKRLYLVNYSFKKPISSILNSLTLLYLKNVAISLEELTGLLINNPLLDNISLTDMRELFPAQPISLKKIRNLLLSKCNTLTYNHLQVFLEKARELKQFELEGFSGSKGDMHFPLSSLEKLILRSTNFSYIEIQHLLHSTHSLKVLILDRTDSLGEYPDSLNLSSLEELFLNSLSLTPENLTKILIHSPNLKYLSLSNLTLELTQLISLSLEELVCKNVKLTFSDLEKITKSSSLKKLIFSHRAPIPRETQPPLSVLEELELGQLVLSGGQIKRWLNRAPHLKKLSLCKSTLSEIAPSIFSSLEHLDLTQCKFDMSWLEKVREKNPLLQITFTPDPTSLVLPFSLPDMPVPPHNPNAMFDYIPTDSDDFNFRYKRSNQTLNQGMVIEKFSQYLTIKQQHLDFIPKIQDGICNALVYYSLIRENWNHDLETIKDWDGRAETIDSVQEFFEHLIPQIQNFQLKNSEKTIYLGATLPLFLKKYQDKPIVLANPWHTIKVQFSKDSWLVYNPDHVNGVVSVPEDELLPYLQKIIGSLVFFRIPVSDSSPPLIDEAPLIDNQQIFLRKGGLLALCLAQNKVILKYELFKAGITFTAEDLEGILIRSLDGIPAWALALMNPDLQLETLWLLREFSLSRTNYLLDLQKSLEACTGYERHDCLVYLYQALARTTPAQSFEPMVKSIASALHIFTAKDHKKGLQTWKQEKPEISSLLAYAQSLLPMAPVAQTKRLIECSSKESIQALQAYLMKYCFNFYRPVFSIDSPDNLVCSAPYIKANPDGFGVMQETGGPLHDFLNYRRLVPYLPPPILLVNYSNFKPDDIIRHHSLIDDKRFADGTPIPEDIIIIGFIDPNQPDCYRGEDFYSRFGPQGVESCPIPEEDLKKIFVPYPPLCPIQDTQDDTTIELGGSQDWEECLFGRWMIQGNQFFFQKGVLEEALSKGRPIRLQNGLWEDERFQTFWKRMMLTGKAIFRDGCLPIPPDISWSFGEGYSWEQLAPYVHFDTSLNPKAFNLNPKHFYDFFRQYQYEEKLKALNTVSGLLEMNHKASLIEVNLTRELTEDEWGRLLLEAKKHEVQIKCHIAPNVALPPLLGYKPPDFLQVTPILWNHTIPQKAPALILTSTDITTTVAQVMGEESWISVEVSKKSSADILSKLDVTINATPTLRFVFEKKITEVQEALEKGQNVLLYGHFSEELIDALTPWLIASELPGRLVLVSDNIIPSSVGLVQHHAVSVDEKKVLLNLSEKENLFFEQHLHLLQNESVDQLRARLTYIRVHHKDNPVEDWDKAFYDSNNAWLGLESLPPAYNKLEPFDSIHSQEKALAFNKKRNDAVNAILDLAPFVFLTGNTASGKSFYGEKELKEQPYTHLYAGESKIIEWATDKFPGRKILFIDEANLSECDWKEFNGLFQSQRCLFMNGKKYPLSGNHKVIFAGNPVQYGGERKLSDFFIHHGNALLFEPMSLEFIYEKLLKPVFEKTPLESRSAVLAKPILDVYRYIVERSNDEVLISPRELQMMALMVESLSRKEPSLDPRLISSHFAYQLGKYLIPESYKQEFEVHFSLRAPVTRQAVGPLLNQDFLVTPSRQESTQLLHDLLNLQEVRRKMTSEQNDAKCYGGLGGIILEGDPSTGKSELVIASLIAKGYLEVHLDKEGPLPPKPFYRIPVSMQLDDKIKILLKAIDEGSVVVIDEINSSPMLERILNDLLMGKVPPDGRRPQKPGFFLIGTQNPVILAGRHKPSNALARRLISINLPPYPRQEMMDILITKKTSPDNAKVMIEAYETNREKAIKQHLTPAPTFRDLLKYAEAHQKRKNQMETELNQTISTVYCRLFAKQSLPSPPTNDTHSQKFDLNP